MRESVDGGDCGEEFVNNNFLFLSLLFCHSEGISSSRDVLNATTRFLLNDKRSNDKTTNKVIINKPAQTKPAALKVYLSKYKPLLHPPNPVEYSEL